MNLHTKNKLNYGLKVLRFTSLNGLFLILTAISLSSCHNLTDDGLIVGDEETNSNLKVIKIDTLTVKFSTYKFDSLITSNASRILIGQYEDPIFGKIKASSFFELKPTTYSIDEDAVFDSICMVLKYDDYYINDTLQPCTFHVRRISENVKPEEDYFYTTSSLTTYAEPLGSKTFLPRPLSESDSLLIKLSPLFGTQIFEKIQDNEINSEDEFLEFFKGIQIEADENDNSAILGFSNTSSDSVLRIYFSLEEAGEIVSYHYDMKMDVTSTPAKFFNRIVSDRNGTDLAILSNQSITLSDVDANKLAFIQSGIGIVTKIEFPYLKDIYDIPGQVSVLDAKLYLNPKLGTYSTWQPLPETFEIYQVNRKNYLGSQMYDTAGNVLMAKLNTENSEFQNIYYSVDMGIYIEGLLQSEYEDGTAFILKPVNLNTTTDRVVFNTRNTSEIKTYLELTIVTYE